ncbi:DUF6531 domain-containing protein [Pelomonas aquatica]|uniref:RHS repeat protein n=2 Tax=Pelomonas aquatica TaxID=431058 RepID=A0A9X4LHC1_9BURK|nr:RHS repeat protein [Pelomonas aquatica]
MNAARFPSALRDLSTRCGLLPCIAALLWTAVALQPSAQAAVLQSPLASCPPNMSCAPDPKPPICSILPNDPRCTPGGGGGGPTCTAPGGGSPNCGGSGPASVGGGGSGGVSVGGGNPINLLSGNKYQEETDLPALPGVLGLELKRYYNSDASYPGLSGANWRTSYETVLYDLGSQLQIVQADGRRITLQRGVGANARLCTSTQLQDGQVRIEQTGPEGRDRVYRWRWADGRVLSFRAVGATTGGYPLHEIRAASGEHLQLRYSPLGDLIGVTDPQGRKLEFIYAKAAPGQRAPLQAVLTPLGRIGYQHDAQGRLTAVSQYAPGKDGQPQASAYVTRLYHYEAQYNGGYGYLLTGISVQAPGENKGSPQRLSTYAYDAQGRAILSTKGLPAEDGKADAQHGIEQVRVDYLRKPSPNEGRPDKSGEVQVSPERLGLVRLTNSLGQTSELKTAVIGGQLRLIEFTGAGCSTCGPSNRRYAYDAEGRLLRSIELDARGQPLRAELWRYDGWHRQVEIAEQLYAAGKPQSPQWRQRLEYTDTRFKDGSLALGMQPTRIEQPSVVPGKSRATEVDYNESGQVLRITEKGWSLVDARGEERPTPVERSTHYRYTLVAGKSVLTEVDGALPNGPKGDPSDSDITRIVWDARGRTPLRMEMPAGLQARFEYGPDGRLASLIGPDGAKTRYSYAADGTLAALDRGGVIQRFENNGSLHLRKVVMAGGQALQFQMDLSGRVAAVWDGPSNRIELQRDTEGQLLQARLLNPDGSIAQTKAWQSDRRDGSANERRDELADGLQQLIGQSESGAEVARPDIWRALSPAQQRLDDILAAGRLASSQGFSEQADSAGRYTIYWRDDFGLLRRADSPTTGSTRYDYDAAGRLIGQRDNVGDTARYQRDAAGRVIAIQARDAQGQLDEDAHIEWGANNKPSRIRSLHSDERFAYDRTGQLSEHSQTVDGHSWTLRYTYDANGQLIAKQMPGGQQLAYRYRGSQHPRAGLLESVWLKGWVDRPLVHGLNDEADTFANRRFMFGNGLGNELRLDDQGRAIEAGSPEVGQTRLSYTSADTEPGVVRTQRGTSLGQVANSTSPPLWQGRLYGQWDRWRGSDSAAQPASFRLAGIATPGHELFDDLGRQITRGELRLSYDSLGRLVEVQRDAKGEALQPVARYRYNVFGQRIAKVTVQAGSQVSRTTYFFHDGSQLVAEADAAGAVQRQYVWINDKPVALLETGQVLYIHTDHRNAPLALTNAARQVVWQAQVADFLAASVVQGASLGRVEFNLRGSNQYHDPETELHYNTHRYYDAQAGRYLTPDPMGLAVGPDLYAFALNRPHSLQDPLGLAPAGTDVSGWSFGDKLVEVVSIALKEKLPSDLAAALSDLVSPSHIATTAAIFALWAGSHALGIGFAFDAVMLGVAYYTLGKAAADLIVGLIDTTIAINAAKCSGDLDAAAAKLSKALGKGTAAFIEGAVLRKVFSKTEGDLGATAIESLKKSVNYAKSKVVNAASSAAKLGFRSSSWAAISSNAERGFVGEIDAWSWLMSGKAKLQALCCKTIDPNKITNQAEYDTALAAYKGTKGVDGAFESQPGFFKRLLGGKDQYYVIESKATGGTFSHTKAELNGLLNKTKAGDQQLSNNWLGIDKPADPSSRLNSSVGTSAATEMQKAFKEGRLTRVLATTDSSGTRYWEVKPDPTDPKKVAVGDEITSLFK